MSSSDTHNMEQQFLKTLREVLAEAKKNKNTIEEEEIIKAFEPSPSEVSRYSVWPGKGNSSLWMVALLMGAVTRTSIFPSRKSATARSSASNAALPASREAFPVSTLASSPITLMMHA